MSSIKCQINGCEKMSELRIRSKETGEFFHLCFDHAESGKDQNFSKMFLNTGIV